MRGASWRVFPQRPTFDQPLLMRGTRVTDDREHSVERSTGQMNAALRWFGGRSRAVGEKAYLKLDEISSEASCVFVRLTEVPFHFGRRGRAVCPPWAHARECNQRLIFLHGEVGLRLPGLSGNQE